MTDTMKRKRTDGDDDCVRIKRAVHTLRQAIEMKANGTVEEEDLLGKLEEIEEFLDEPDEEDLGNDWVIADPRCQHIDMVGVLTPASTRTMADARKIHFICPPPKMTQPCFFCVVYRENGQLRYASRSD